jgi:transcriptional regulator with XRE-family HTH domain
MMRSIVSGLAPNPTTASREFGRPLWFFVHTATAAAILVSMAEITDQRLLLEKLPGANAYLHVLTPLSAFESTSTAAKDLDHIKAILKPSVTELASALKVSRQAIYDWQSGSQVKPENFAKLRELSTAADLFAARDEFFIHQTLRRKIGGQNFFARIQGGESSVDVAIQLLEIANSESDQRIAVSALLKNRPQRADLVEVPGPRYSDENG